jgi:DNA-binding MarR family transcriptional regulator
MEPGRDSADTITGQIRRANVHLDRNAEEVFGRFNTTGASFDVLAALYGTGPPYQMTPTELYRGHMMSSAGVTARLDVVERAGLAARSRDPRDRRGVIVTLTKAGQKMVRDAAQALYRRQAFVLTLYPERERRQLLNLLKDLLGSLEGTGSGSLPTYEVAIRPWVREFPKENPWLVEFLLVTAMLAGHINRETDLLLDDDDLAQTAFFVLAALRRSGDAQRLSPRDLSRAAIVSSAGMTAQLDQLEARGLVSRSPHPGDRRAIYVTLTRPGQKLADKAIEAYNAGHKRMLSALSSSDRQALGPLLRKLLTALEAGNGSRAPGPTRGASGSMTPEARATTRIRTPRPHKG